MQKKFSLSVFTALVVALCLSSSCDVLVTRDNWPTGTPREAFSKNAVNFLVLGDWGKRGNTKQQNVALQMGIEAGRDSSQFVISAGDNFYNSGVRSVTDTHWQESFEQVYNSPSLQIPWYVSLGNHDYEGNINAQIEYTDLSDRWYLPAPYYTKEIHIDDSTTALVVFLDTTPLTEEKHDAESIGKASDGPAYQLKWLNETLEASTEDWRIVVGHHPLFSAGSKHRNNTVLIHNLRKLLEQHEVHMYLSGHSHNLQHLKPEGKVHYFVSGSGSHVRGVSPNHETVMAKSVPGFIAVSLTPEYIYTQFVDFKGEVHHEAMISQ